MGSGYNINDIHTSNDDYGSGIFSLWKKSRRLEDLCDCDCETEWGAADQTHRSHNIAPAVATGIGCGWQAQAALGSKMALKTSQKHGCKSPRFLSQGAITPPGPSILFQYRVGMKCHMTPDVKSHEVSQQSSQRPSVQSAGTHPHPSALLQHRHWYLNGEGLQLACHTVRQATYFGQHRKTEFWINWGYRILNQMCDQVATEIVPSGEDYRRGREEEWQKRLRKKMETYRGSATEK